MRERAQQQQQNHRVSQQYFCHGNSRFVRRFVSCLNLLKRRHRCCWGAIWRKASAGFRQHCLTWPTCTGRKRPGLDLNEGRRLRFADHLLTFVSQRRFDYDVDYLDTDLCGTDLWRSRKRISLCSGVTLVSVLSDCIMEPIQRNAPSALISIEFADMCE